MAQIESYASGTPAGTDQIPYIEDPAGTPVLKLAAVSDLGGGGLPSVDDPVLWTPDEGYDYEFNAVTSSLPSDWAWVNQGASTYEEKFGAGIMSVADTGGNNVRGLVRSLPSGDWQATIKLFGYVPTDYRAMFILRDSVGGQLVAWVVAHSGGVYLQRWNSPTSYNGQYTSWSAVPWPYSRITRTSSTSYTFEMAVDGICWAEIGTFDLSGFLTPDEIGFGNWNNGGMNNVACQWLRVRT